MKRSGQPDAELFFGSTGEVQLPDRVRMTMSIDRPDARGVKSEVLYIKRLLYVKPAGGSEWRRSSQPVLLAGFDPLAVFDFRTLSRTRRIGEPADTRLDGAAAKRLRLTPTEEFRKKAEDRLPKPDFEGTKLLIRQDLWVDDATGRIVRFVQRYDYVGKTSGFFQTDLRLKSFGKRVRITVPPATEVSDQPLQVGATPTP